MSNNIKISHLIDNAQILIGDSTKDNPEYTRGIIELIAMVMPMEHDHAIDTLGVFLDIDVNEL